MKNPTIDDHMDDLVAHPRFSEAFLTRMDNPASWGPDSGYLITIPDTPIPAGWSHERITLSFWVSVYFPCVPPSGFWTVEDVRLTPTGHIPQWSSWGRTDRNVLAPGHKVLWHWQPAMWSAVGDGLLTAAHFMRRRFDKLR